MRYLPWHQPPEPDDRVCLCDEHRELTYAQTAREVEAVAGQLRRRGVGPDPVLAVMLPNPVELLLTLYAAWRLGATRLFTAV